MFGTAGRAVLSKLKSMEYQSKICWKPINSSLKAGLAQHSSSPFLGAGWGAADAGLDLSQMPRARAAFQPAQGGKVCEQHGWASLSVQGMARRDSPARSLAVPHP